MTTRYPLCRDIAAAIRDLAGVEHCRSAEPASGASSASRVYQDRVWESIKP